MSKKITFEDKISKQILVEDEVHKITADNVNEIKEVVNVLNCNKIIEEELLKVEKKFNHI